MLMKPDPRASVNQDVIRAAQQLTGEKVKMYTHQTLSTAKGLSFMWTLLHRVYVGFERCY